MDIYIYIWIYVDLYGFIWIYMDLYGHIDLYVFSYGSIASLVLSISKKFPWGGFQIAAGDDHGISWLWASGSMVPWLL